ncbi:hypothetical protein AVEN_146064-1 [Araneus ventricosus]|uniref:Uncharacterized protein n=1 Tax=Araneus ventricosus TaxID=182803 RepID=A0A4Y2LH72_ARAVE|nr:hypothetical protein AVEN_146064-1 [Araneus ventricosus]
MGGRLATTCHLADQVQQTHMRGSTSMESGFEHGTFRSRRRDFTSRLPLLRGRWGNSACDFTTRIVDTLIPRFQTYATYDHPHLRQRKKKIQNET